MSESVTQVGAAQAKGLRVEWLVSDEVAKEHLARFFRENNVNINVKYLAE